MLLDKELSSTSIFSTKSLFVNFALKRGKKLAAEYFLIDVLCSLKLMEYKFKLCYQFDVFYISLMKLRPLVLLRRLKMGSVAYRIPTAPSERKKKLFSVKILFDSIRELHGRLAFLPLVKLFVSVFFSEENVATDKKLGMYAMAEDNRPFVRFLK